MFVEGSVWFSASKFLQKGFYGFFWSRTQTGFASTVPSCLCLAYLFSKLLLKTFPLQIKCLWHVVDKTPKNKRLCKRSAFLIFLLLPCHISKKDSILSPFWTFRRLERTSVRWLEWLVPSIKSSQSPFYIENWGVNVKVFLSAKINGVEITAPILTFEKRKYGF